MTGASQSDHQAPTPALLDADRMNTGSLYPPGCSFLTYHKDKNSDQLSGGRDTGREGRMNPQTKVPGVRPVLTAGTGPAHCQGHNIITIISAMLMIIMITALSQSPALGPGGDVPAFPVTGLAHGATGHGLCPGTSIIRSWSCLHPGDYSQQPRGQEVQRGVRQVSRNSLPVRQANMARDEPRTPSLSHAQ